MLMVYVTISTIVYRLSTYSQASVPVIRYTGPSAGRGAAAPSDSIDDRRRSRVATHRHMHILSYINTIVTVMVYVRNTILIYKNELNPQVTAIARYVASTRPSGGPA